MTAQHCRSRAPIRHTCCRLLKELAGVLAFKGAMGIFGFFALAGGLVGVILLLSARTSDMGLQVEEVPS